MGDPARESRREAIWQAAASWGLAGILFVVVQALRPRVVAIFNALDETVCSGFILLTEPNQSGLGLTLGRLYRLMHNLTVPYVMAFYVVAFMAAFFLFRRKDRRRRGRRAFKIAGIVIHLAFFALWGTSLSMPEDVFGAVLCSDYQASPLEPRLDKVPDDVRAFLLSARDQLSEYDLRRLAEVPGGGARAVIEFCKTGTEDGDVEAIAGEVLLFAADDPYPILLEASRSPKVRTRGFAATVMGHLGDERYLPRLEEMKTDSAPLYPHWAGRETTGKVAETSIEWIRRCQDNLDERRSRVREMDAWIRNLR